MAEAITKIELINAPLNPNGLFTISFDSTAAREGYFDSKVVSTINNCVFVRKDNIIKVPGNSDTLDSLGVNYIRYRNTSFTGRVFYAFVRDIRYVAPDTTELTIETDSFMTYQFDIVYNQAFIERRTVPTDVAGENILPEPISVNQYRKAERINRSFNTRTKDAFSGSFYAGVVVGGLNPSTLDPQTPDPNEAAKRSINEFGKKYAEGVPLGGILLCTTLGDDFTALIRGLAALNGNVICTFPVPNNLGFDTLHVTVRQGNEDITFDVYTPTGALAVDDYPAVNKFQNPWSFGIHNNKLLTYPYNFLLGSNHEGSEIIYRYEQFTSEACEFLYRYVWAPTPCLFLQPSEYEGIDDISNAVINNSVPGIPWSGNAYETYIAENRNSLIFTQVSKSLNYGINLAKGGLSGDLGGLLTGSFDFALSKEARKASLEDMKGLGDSVHNIPSGCLQGSVAQLGVYVYQKFLSENEAKRIDAFFDRFGYAYEKTETINVKACSNYDYVKTQGANIGGTIPMKDKAKINNLLDSGLTVWHKSANYGDYSAGPRG